MAHSPVRPVALALLLPLFALAACTTTGSTPTQPGAEDAAATAGVPGPGVTADTITVGMLTLGGANSAGSGGFNVSPQGDTQQQAQVLTDYINDQGGIAGRQVKPVLREFDSSTSSPTAETAVCKSFTQDDEAFAVIALGQRTNAARTCYQKAETTFLDVSQAAQPSSVYTELAPYYWTPNSVPLDVATKSLLTDLGASDVLRGAKVGVLVEKDPSFESVYDEVVVPGLAELGATGIRAEIDQSTTENGFATAGAAASSFQKSGVDHVMFLGRPDNVGFFTTFTTQQNYYPTLILGSFETPKFMAQNPSVYPAKSLSGAQGIGFLPDVDEVPDYAFPAPGAETTCINILGDAGITFEGRAEAKTALRFCDGLMFLKTVGDQIGPDGVMNAANMAAVAAGLGSTWQAATTLGTSFGTEGATTYAPGAGYRTLVYDGVFAYDGDTKNFS